MRISREWLTDYVDFDDLSDDQFAELITTRVAEVDEVVVVASPLKDAVVARVKAIAVHPDRPKLKIATIQTGSEEVQVVCGAPNCETGLMTAYLPPGTCSVHLGAGGTEQTLIKVEGREIAGVQSAGILVSEAELGLSGDHTGIIDLSLQLVGEAFPSRKHAGSSVQAGVRLAEYVGEPVTVLEIDNKSLTHRPDLWSHFGFARELAAILGRPLKMDADRWADNTTKGAELFAGLGIGNPEFGVEISPGCGGRRFAALEIRGVRAVPSPFWMKRRLFSVGAGVRNLLVDLSNYVMHDLGQPNHAYDADLLTGNTVYVRAARKDEEFLALDGENRTLCPEDIVIADESGAVALGGVIGGETTAVCESTTRLLLESANFDPICIRRTTKRHQLRTDASNRFEKSLSPFAVPLAIQRFVEIIKTYIPGAATYGAPADCFIEKPEPIRVPLRFEYIRERLGSSNDDEEISGILTSLGFQSVTVEDGSCWTRVPYYRATRDVSIEDDLVEEVGRIFGYEHIMEQAPKIESVAPPARPLAEFENKVQDLLSALGYSEVYNYSFMNEARASSLGYSVAKTIRLENPIDSNTDLVRTTLVPGVLELLDKNKRNFPSLLIYEIGRGYQAEPDQQHENLALREPVKDAAAFEKRLLCLAYSSGIEEESLAASVSPNLTSGADFYAVLNVIRRVSRLVSTKDLEVRAITSDPSRDVSGNGQPSEAGDFASCKRWMHPYRAASVSLNGISFGVVAEVRPDILDDFSNRAVVAEIDLDLLLEADRDEALFSPLPKYPDSFFEMSVVMPKTTCYEELKRIVVEQVAPSLLKKIEVVSVYEGKPLEKDQKSVSVKLFLGAQDRTLSGSELTEIQQGLIKAIEESPFALRT